MSTYGRVQLIKKDWLHCGKASPSAPTTLLSKQQYAQAAHLPFCSALKALFAVTNLMGDDCLNVTAPPRCIGFMQKCL